MKIIEVLSFNYPQRVEAGFIIDLVRRIHGRPEDFSEGDLEHRIWKYLRYELRQIRLPVNMMWGVDSSKVNQYSVMDSGTTPPIIFDPIDNSIIDGSHRIEAAKLRGDKVIMAYVGTDPDPHWAYEEDEDY
jgi:hypothetical protein